MKNFLFITKKLFLDGGRIVEVKLDGAIDKSSVGRILENGIETHKCIAVNADNYETIMALTRWINVKHINGFEHVVKKISDVTFTGSPESQYLVTRPIIRVREEFTSIKKFDKASEYWNKYGDSIFEIIKGELNNPENILELNEITRRLLEG